jgi:hypothetical protein
MRISSSGLGVSEAYKVGGNDGQRNVALKVSSGDRRGAGGARAGKRLAFTAHEQSKLAKHMTKAC